MRKSTKPSPTNGLQLDAERPLSQFCSERFVVANLKGRTPRAVIGELAGVLADASVFPDKHIAVDAAIAREKILTTAVHGVAFPHVRGIGDGSVICAIGLSRNGVEWAGESVHLVVFTSLPESPDPVYLRLMMAFSKSFSSERRMSEICESDTDQSFWDGLCKVTKTALKRF